MQFDPEESGEDRRRRQRDYHAFLDAQVEARNRARLLLEAPAADNLIEDAVLPSIPMTGRLKHQQLSSPSHDPYSSATNTGKSNGSLNLPPQKVYDGGGAELRELIRRCTARDDMLDRLEQRLESEAQRRHSLEGTLATFGEKLENLLSDAVAKNSSLGARGAAMGEIREQTHTMGGELAVLREWRLQVDKTLALTPKVHETTQKQVQALEEEARTRMQSDEARAVNFRQSIERLSGEVNMIATRVADEEKGTLQRIANLEVALTGESKGSREATNQLRQQVQELTSLRSSSDDNMISLQQRVRLLENRHQGSHSMLAAARAEDERSRQEMQARSAYNPSNTTAKPRQKSLRVATAEQLVTVRGSLVTELSGLMGETAKRVVETTGIPQDMSALRGRLEVAEERLSIMSEKSVRALEEQLHNLRTEVVRLQDRPHAGPVATSVRELAHNMATAQAVAQTQLTELQDALSAEITARRRNALRLAEAQAAMKEGDKESVVQVTSSLKSRCLELEELVKDLTRDTRTIQEELSSQTQAKMLRAHEQNSKAVGKLEDSLAGIRNLMAQHEADVDRTWVKVNARAEELDGLINSNKTLLREAEERARSALAASETRRQVKGQQLNDKIDGLVSEEAVKREALEQAMREQAHTLRESMQAGDRTATNRLEDLQGKLQRLGEKMQAVLADALKEERRNVTTVVGEAQGQLNRDLERVQLAIDRAAVDGNTENATAQCERQALRQRIQAEETARADDVQSLWQTLAEQGERLEARVRLWAEDRLQKERAGTEDAMKRAQAHSNIVRGLLDETVKAVSKELDTVRAESRGRDLTLEELLDKRLAALEERTAEVDSGAAKKRRLSDMGKETGLRIGGMERRLRQAEQNLKDELEVKLAVSSLVCTVAENAPGQRLTRHKMEEWRVGALQQDQAIATERDLRVETGNIRSIIASMQVDFATAKGQLEEAISGLQTDLLTRILELKAMVEVTNLAASTDIREVSRSSTSRALDGEANKTETPDFGRECESLSAVPAAKKTTKSAEGAGHLELERGRTENVAERTQYDNRYKNEPKENESKTQLDRQTRGSSDRISVSSLKPDESDMRREDKYGESSSRSGSNVEEEATPMGKSDQGSEASRNSEERKESRTGSSMTASQSGTESDNASDYKDDAADGSDGDYPGRDATTAGGEIDTEPDRALDDKEYADSHDDSSDDRRPVSPNSDARFSSDRSSELNGDSGSDAETQESDQDQDGRGLNSASTRSASGSESSSSKHIIDGLNYSKGDSNDSGGEHNESGNEGSPGSAARARSDISSDNSQASRSDDGRRATLRTPSTSKSSSDGTEESSGRR